MPQEFHPVQVKSQNHVRRAKQHGCKALLWSCHKGTIDSIDKFRLVSARQPLEGPMLADEDVRQTTIAQPPKTQSRSHLQPPRPALHRMPGLTPMQTHWSSWGSFIATTQEPPCSCRVHRAQDGRLPGFRGVGGNQTVILREKTTRTRRTDTWWLSRLPLGSRLNGSAHSESRVTTKASESEHRHESCYAGRHVRIILPLEGWRALWAPAPSTNLRHLSVQWRMGVVGKHQDLQHKCLVTLCGYLACDVGVVGCEPAKHHYTFMIASSRKCFMYLLCFN